jgi:hypothetical protein
MVAFRDCLQVCGLDDLGFSGLPFKYDNKRAGINNVRVHLDHAVADNSWRDMCVDSSIVHLVSSCSHHCTILMDMEKLCLPTV